MKLLVVILGFLLLVGCVSAAPYAYASQYPPAHNTTYVKSSTYYNTEFYPYFATDPSLSLVGGSANNQWYSSNLNVTNQTINIDLGSAKVIKRIYYENAHVVGANTNRGLRYFTIWASNSAPSFANTTYSNTTGWTRLGQSQDYFDEHVGANTTDPKYITLTTNTSSYRYYSIRPSTNWGATDIMGIRRIELQTEVSWVYTAPGTYYWVCPANVTTVSMNLGGGGGSGKGAYYSVSTFYIGYGGAAGGWSNYVSIPVTPATNYTIVVGAGGAASALNATSNAGGLSSAFSYTAAGGAGGASTPYVSNFAGGAGANGFLTGGNADAGGDVAGFFAGGAAGTGYCAGGGGGAAKYTPLPQEGGVGGKGSDGYVGIYQTGYSNFNTPDFSGTPVTGIAGTLVQFTDESTVIDNVNLTYLWDFGDGSTSTTIGDVQHVFAYVGSYTVSLTITSDAGSVTEEKEAYINLVSPTTELDLDDKPIPVQFHVQDFWGASLTDANVSIQGISTSTGNWDWIVTLLGIPLDEVAINGTEMYQTTDSYGNVEFLMVPTIKYNVTTTLAGYTFPVLYITPHDSEYPITANANLSDMFGVRNSTVGKSNISVMTEGTAINATHGRINLTFMDTESSVTGGTISIYRQNATAGGARILVDTMPVSSSSFSNNSTIVALTGTTGTSFIVHTNATSSLEPGVTIQRDSIESFNGMPAVIGWVSSEITLMLAVFIILITAMFSGRISGTGMGIAVCAEAWIFYAMGWFNMLVTIWGSAVVIGCFTLATVATVIWAISEGWGGQT